MSGLRGCTIQKQQGRISGLGVSDEEEELRRYTLEGGGGKVVDKLLRNRWVLWKIAGWANLLLFLAFVLGAASYAFWTLRWWGWSLLMALFVLGLFFAFWQNLQFYSGGGGGG